MRFTRLNDWLNWLEQLHPVEIELGLGRVKAVAERLKLNAQSAKVVTVSGTNGKGSTIAALQSLLLHCHPEGQPAPRVGTYTSPHLIHFTERITIDAKPVNEDLLCQVLDEIDSARLQSPEISLSYFEYTTLAALLIFSRAGLDYILLEVGLGGRLDAVNIIDADIAVITQIDLDHQSWLGDTREQIALEKAGILRAGQSAVIADDNPPETLIERLQALNCAIYWSQRPKGCAIGAEYGYLKDGFLTDAAIDDELDITGNSPWQGASWQGVNREGDQQLIAGLPAPKLAWQSWSAALQVAVLLDVITDNVLNCEQLTASPQALCSQVQLAGRLSTAVLQGRELLLDVAHNTQAVGRLAEFLQWQPAAGNTIAVFAVMADKDIPALLAPVLLRFQRWYLPQLANCPRAATPQQLEQVLIDQYQRPQAGSGAVTIKPEIHCGGSVESCLLNVINNSSPEDKIVVFGSFYTVGEALACAKRL